MEVNAGWVVYVMVMDRRHYVSDYLFGEPAFTFDLAKAKYYEDRQAQSVSSEIGRLFDGVRLLYVTVHARREMGVSCELWSGAYAR